MSDAPIDFWTMEFGSDQGLKFRAYRPYLLTELDNVSASPDCFLDTGAPFCVVPNTIARKVPWRSLGQSLTHKGRPADLMWSGLPCELGEASLALLDPGTGLPFRR